MAYRDEILALAPSFYWRCHETASGTILDEVNPAHTANQWTTNNDFNQAGPPLPNSEVGASIHFRGTLDTGSNDSATATNNSFTGTSATFMFYFKHDSTGSDPYPNIFGHNRTVPARWAIHLEPPTNPANPFRLFVKRQGGTHNNSYYSPALTNNTWYHFAFVYNRTAETGKWYIDGVHQPAVDVNITAAQWDGGTGGNAIANLTWQFGTWGYSNERVAGYLSEVALFPYDLTAAQVGNVVTGTPITDPGGAPGATSLTIAPEALPHRISHRDTGGNRALAKKLQDNFDAIERQLLAIGVEEE